MDTAGEESPSLLLIEENRSIMGPLRDWLTMALPDVQLIQTTDRRRGVYLNRSQKPDAVLTDVSALGARGAEHIGRVKAAQPEAAVFALVGVDHPPNESALIRAGAEACTSIWNLRTDLLPHLQTHLKTKRHKIRSGVPAA